MFRVIGCITQEHDIRLLLLAACICALGCATTTILLSRAQGVSVPTTYKWLLGAAVVFGAGVWSLHFVAMLAFMPGMPIAYDLPTTSISIGVAVFGSLVAFSAWRLLPRRSGAIGAGAALAAAVAGMHYTGIAAMEVPGTMTVDHGMVAASLGVCLTCALIAFVRSDKLSTAKWRRWEVSGWLALCICGVHFIGMAAIQIKLGLTYGPDNAVMGSDTLAIVVATVSLALLVVSLAAALMDRHLFRRHNQELDRMRMLSDFAQEGIVIHRGGKVLEVNSAGTRLFGKPADWIIGRPILSLFAEKSVPSLRRRMMCPQEQLLSEEVEIETTAGSPIPVEFSCRVIDFRGQPATAVALRDLTDRKNNEARILHLAHHDALTDLPNRSLLQERLSRALAVAAQEVTKTAILYLDLDRFKPVNDVLGHAGGDALLVQVAERLNAEIRSADTLARVGATSLSSCR
jgi:PAS domain S-box-containing protein